MKAFLLIAGIFLSCLSSWSQAPVKGLFDLDTARYPYSIFIIDQKGDSVYRKSFDGYGNLTLLDNDVRYYEASYHDSSTYAQIIHRHRLKKSSFHQRFFPNGKMRSHYYVRENHEGYESFYSNGKKRSEYSDNEPYCLSRNFDINGIEIYHSERDDKGNITLSTRTDSGFVGRRWRLNAHGDTMAYFKWFNGRTIKGFDKAQNKRIWSVADTTYIVTPKDSIIKRGSYQQDRYENDGTHHHWIDIWTKDSKTSISYKEHPDSGIHFYHFQYRNFIDNVQALRYEWKKDLSNNVAYLERRYHDFPKSTAPMQYEVHMDRDSNLLYTYESSYYDMYNPKKEIRWTQGGGYEVVRHKKPKKPLSWRKKLYQSWPPMSRVSDIRKLYDAFPQVKKSLDAQDTAKYKLISVSIKTGARKYSEDDFIKELFHAKLNGGEMGFDEFQSMISSMLNSYQLRYGLPFPRKLECYIEPVFSDKCRIRLTGDGESSAIPFADELQKWLMPLKWSYGEYAQVIYNMDGEVFSTALQLEQSELFMELYHQGSNAVSKEHEHIRIQAPKVGK